MAGVESPRAKQRRLAKENTPELEGEEGFTCCGCLLGVCRPCCSLIGSFVACIVRAFCGTMCGFCIQIKKDGDKKDAKAAKKATDAQLQAV